MVDGGGGGGVRGAEECWAGGVVVGRFARERKGRESNIAGRVGWQCAGVEVNGRELKLGWTWWVMQAVTGKKHAVVEGVDTRTVRAGWLRSGRMLLALLMCAALCCAALRCVAVLQDLQDQGPQVCWRCTQGVQACGCA
jgi:hypothetical protein